MRVFCVSSCLITLALCSSISAGENTTEMATVAACVKRMSITGKPTNPIAIPTKVSKKRHESVTYPSDMDDDSLSLTRNSTSTNYLATPSPATSFTSINSISPCSAASSRKTSPDSRRSSDDNDSWGSRFSSFSFDIPSASGGSRYFPLFGQRGSN